MLEEIKIHWLCFCWDQHKKKRLISACFSPCFVLLVVLKIKTSGNTTPPHYPWSPTLFPLLHLLLIHSWSSSNLPQFQFQGTSGTSRSCQLQKLWLDSDDALFFLSFHMQFTCEIVSVCLCICLSDWFTACLFSWLVGCFYSVCTEQRRGLYLIKAHQLEKVHQSMVETEML